MCNNKLHAAIIVDVVSFTLLHLILFIGSQERNALYNNYEYQKIQDVIKLKRVASLFLCLALLLLCLLLLLLVDGRDQGFEVGGG